MRFDKYWFYLRATKYNLMSNIITLSQAETETHAYQNAIQFQGLTRACAADASAYSYFALNSNNGLTIVVVGVNSLGEDMTNGIILGDTKDCPFHCHGLSPLMP
jgi:hypothetical protein